MYKHIVFRILAGLVLLAAIAGIAFFAYQAGVTHSAEANVQLPPAGNGEYFHPFFWNPFLGSGILGLVFGFFLLMLAFNAMRHLIFGPRWGWRHMGHGQMGHGRMEHGPWGEGVPPMFAEWHRRAHAAPESDGTTEKNQK
jgi:hypothetical protein